MNKSFDQQQTFYQVRIGPWTKVIQFIDLPLPPTLFLTALSFLLVPNTELQPSKVDIVFKGSKTNVIVSGINVVKQNRIIFWKSGKRHIKQDSFIIRIEKLFSQAILIGDVQWDVVVDLLESWVGHLYEVERGVRLHAVAFDHFVLIAKSGFGKTHLAFHNWNRLIADEVIYVHQQKIENLHTSIRLKKQGPWKSRYGAREIHVKVASIQSLPKVYLDNSSVLSFFLGIGLPQHLEFAFFIKKLFSFMIIALRRILFIFRTNLLSAPRLNREQAEQLLKS